MSTNDPDWQCMATQLANDAKQQGFCHAVDQLYQWSVDNNYINLAALAHNPAFSQTDPKTGITFKLQVNVARSQYSRAQEEQRAAKPDCYICHPNDGGPMPPGRRFFPITLAADQQFFCQLTPFPLAKKHLVLIADRHRPMRMDGQSVADLLILLEHMPSLSVFSNSDVAWAGASILAHHHYQAIDAYDLPIYQAKALDNCQFSHQGCDIALLNYPIAACRITGESPVVLNEIAEKIILNWKANHPKRNTCNLIARKNNQRFELTIIFRNPIFRTASWIVPLKSEGIGVIEVAGETILPVPAPDKNEKKHWQMIRTRSLDIITGIMQSNNPIVPEKYKSLYTNIMLLIKNQ